MAGNVNGSNLTVKGLRAMACDVEYLRASLHPPMVGAFVSIDKSVALALSERKSDLFSAVCDARRAVNLIDQYCENENGARSMELAIQDWHGSAFNFRVHICCGGSLINITSGVAALLGARTIETGGRWWLRWNNGRDDLARRLGDMLGVKFYVHVI